MFIDQVILQNFRVYYGTNLLQLSRAHNHHITVISGNNGFGKTSFLTGLVWGLYGKLMADVDPRYRQDILESGGYKRYCEKLMNRLALAESSQTEPDLFNKAEQPDTFSISLHIGGLMIPTVQCESVIIKRSYQINKHIETVEILIDGRVNELTKNVGPEIFINDFILPREIAKFFFFDAEKIVSLSEIKSAEEKRYLSQAYAEVLGIKKYLDLKTNLENVRLRLRDKTAERSDRSRLTKLQNQLIQNEKLIKLYRESQDDKSETLQCRVR